MSGNLLAGEATEGSFGSGFTTLCLCRCPSHHYNILPSSMTGTFLPILEDPAQTLLPLWSPACSPPTWPPFSLSPYVLYPPTMEGHSMFWELTMFLVLLSFRTQLPLPGMFIPWCFYLTNTYSSFKTHIAHLWDLVHLLQAQLVVPSPLLPGNDNQCTYPVLTTVVINWHSCFLI